MGLGTRILPEAQRSLAAASVVAGYAAVGTPFAHPALFVMFVNATDADVQISIDGINDTFPLLARSAFVFDISSDQVREGGLFISKLTQIYAKQLGVPTTGSVYVTPWYSKES